MNNPETRRNVTITGHTNRGVPASIDLDYVGDGQWANQDGRIVATTADVIKGQMPHGDQRED